MKKRFKQFANDDCLDVIKKMEEKYEAEKAYNAELKQKQDKRNARNTRIYAIVFICIIIAIIGVVVSFVSCGVRNYVKFSRIDEDTCSIAGVYAVGKKSITDVKIPLEYKGKDVVRIDASAFKNCNSLKKVSISSNVKEIGESAFSSCDALSSVDMTDSVEIIGGSTFYNCDSLV